MPAAALPGRDELSALAASLRSARFPDGLRAALDPGQVGREVDRRIHELVPGAQALVALRLEDARALRDGWSLRFAAGVTTADGARTVALVAGRPASEDAGRTPGDVWLPHSGLSCRVADADTDAAGLPALRLLSDPLACAQLLEPALQAAGWPGLRLDAVVPRVVRLKPGRRATLVHELTYAEGADPAWPRRVVTKTYRDDDGAETHRWMDGLWRSRLGRSRVVRLARPLAWWEEQRTLLQSALPGDRTLADLLADPTAVPARHDALEAAADGLVALHGCGVRTGPVRAGASEAAAAQRLLGRLEHSLPAATLEAAGRLLDQAARLVSDDHPGRELVPVHGAFRPAQVLLDGSRPGFLDFDGFGQGERAADVGRFVARLAEMIGDGPDGAAAAAVFVDRYRAGADVLPERITRYVVLDHAVGAVRAWYRGDDERAARLLGLLTETLRRA